MVIYYKRQAKLNWIRNSRENNNKIDVLSTILFIEPFVSDWLNIWIITLYTNNLTFTNVSIQLDF